VLISLSWSCNAGISCRRRHFILVCVPLSICNLISIEIHFVFSIYIFYSVKPCNIIDFDYIKEKKQNELLFIFFFYTIISIFSLLSDSFLTLKPFSGIKIIHSFI
jgi:hypothetical protein